MKDFESELLRADYAHTVEQFKLLADIRFKLLAFVPTLAGVAVALLTSDTVTKETSLAVGLLGFIVTVGITFYEIRNSQMYDAAIHRAKWLEALLNLPVTTQGAERGGFFNERPRHRLNLFGLFAVWHDRGLSMAYGAALGGWTLITADSVLALSGNPSFTVSLLVAVVVGILFAWEIQRLSGQHRPKPSDEVQRQVSGTDEQRVGS